MWRADGKELFWIGLQGTVMAASITVTRDGIQPGPPQALFQTPLEGGLSFAQPSPDGQRFLVLEPASPVPQQPTMVLIQNWAARLKK